MTKFSRRAVLALAGSTFAGSAWAHDTNYGHTHYSGPTTGTNSHVPSPLFMRIEHAFDMESLRRYGGMPGCWVIVAHGDALSHPSWELANTVIEDYPIFFHRRIGVDSITTTSLSRILSGEIRDWSQLGHSTGPIRVHVHNGFLNREALKNLCRRTGIDLHLDGETTFVPSESYDELARSAAADPYSIAIGLREVYPDALALTPVDGHLPMRLTVPYPLRLTARMYLNVGAPQSDVFTSYDYFWQAFVEARRRDSMIQRETGS